jgi:hypothetical protein
LSLHGRLWSSFDTLWDSAKAHTVETTGQSSGNGSLILLAMGASWHFDTSDARDI